MSNQGKRCEADKCETVEPVKAYTPPPECLYVADCPAKAEEAAETKKDAFKEE